MNWLSQSLLATGLLIPCWIAIGFFEKNYGVKSDVFLIWYFIGSILTWVWMSSSGGSNLSGVLPSFWVALSILLVGATLGAGANLLLFRAVETAPNPGVPVAISSFASVGLFLISILLAKVLPGYFSSVKFDTQSLIGVILTVVGVSTLALKR